MLLLLGQGLKILAIPVDLIEFCIGALFLKIVTLAGVVVHSLFYGNDKHSLDELMRAVSLMCPTDNAPVREPARANTENKKPESPS